METAFDTLAYAENRKAAGVATGADIRDLRRELKRGVNRLLVAIIAVGGLIVATVKLL